MFKFLWIIWLCWAVTCNQQQNMEQLRKSMLQKVVVAGGLNILIARHAIVVSKEVAKKALPVLTRAFTKELGKFFVKSQALKAGARAAAHVGAGFAAKAAGRAVLSVIPIVNVAFAVWTAYDVLTLIDYATSKEKIETIIAYVSQRTHEMHILLGSKQGNYYIAQRSTNFKFAKFQVEEQPNISALCTLKTEKDIDQLQKRLDESSSYWNRDSFKFASTAFNSMGCYQQGDQIRDYQKYLNEIAQKVAQISNPNDEL